jgi:hypothetical protein
MLRPRRFRTLLAAFLAAGVLLLGWAAHCPQLHAALCPAELAPGKQSARSRSAHQGHAHGDHTDAHGGHDHGDHDHGDHEAAEAPPDEHRCAVTLFAAGTDLVPPFHFRPPGALPAPEIAARTERLRDRTLRGAHRSCGPPAKRPAPLVAEVRAVA